MQRNERKILGMMAMMVILIVVMASEVYTYVKIDEIVYFKYVWFIFIVLQFYLNKFEYKTFSISVVAGFGNSHV